jgi:hypothetical protein
MTEALDFPLTAALLQGFKELRDTTLAYEFKYPVQTASGQPLQMVLTRPPEKVSPHHQGQAVPATPSLLPRRMFSSGFL